MLKLLIKLALAALVANAAWRVGSAYLTFYRFQDALAEAVRFNNRKSTDEIQQRVLDLASQYDVPLAADGFSIRRDEGHTYIDGGYTQQVGFFPGYDYPWEFTLHVDALTIPGTAAGPSRR